MNWKRIKGKIAFASLLFLAFFVAFVSPVHASSSTDDMTSTITQWLPIILEFAIIGMIFGMLKRFGRW